MTFKKGDLVMIARPTNCCGNAGAVGNFHTVTGTPFHEKNKCQWCGAIGKSTNDVVLDDMYYIETYRLKKIDPPEEGETIGAYKNLKVPA